ncbi:hydroxyacyl-ACP dehydratase HTD2-like protein with hotdog domain [Arthrobacter sp. CAN_A6]|uniref:hypothetical protein n=1 Tax=Arthrobacter sp. CAN_A6 TaxID=2787721 RepID=UPI0018CB2294
MYRSGPGTPSSSPNQKGSSTTEEPVTGTATQPTSTMLFRFSALTGNSHRIYYDADYACQREGYRDLVIHGPLQILLMIHTGKEHHPGKQLTSAQYRLNKPAFLGDDLTIDTKAGNNTVDMELFAASRRPASASASAKMTFSGTHKPTVPAGPSWTSARGTVQRMCTYSSPTTPDHS